MLALFINTTEPVCGVHQFGRNLFGVLEPSSVFQWDYCEPQSEDELRMICEVLNPEVCLINWQALIGGFLSRAPFPWMKHAALCYHDCELDETKWDAILFADPTMEQHDNWHPIGRPIPEFRGVASASPHWPRPIIGGHGFLGGWADQIVYRVMQEFETATIHLLLPFSPFVDPGGSVSRSMAERCRMMVANKPVINLQIEHDFYSPDDLISNLADSDLNCYIRPPEMNWRGVSSAPDAALAARKPIAVNKCSAFRHLHHANPSICIEDNSLKTIMANGLNSLLDFYKKWSPEAVRGQCEDVLLRVCNES